MRVFNQKEDIFNAKKVVDSTQKSAILCHDEYVKNVFQEIQI